MKLSVILAAKGAEPYVKVSINSHFSSTPAGLSAPLSSLFPAGIVAAELRAPGDPGLLLPAEAEYLERASPKRIQEFAAGRLCARRALAEFGVHDFALRVGDDRRPIWPDFIVGSITHTAGFCAAVVAERKRFAGVGVDSEIVGHVPEDIWPSICVAQETAWLHSLAASEQAAAVTLVFAAKEAFYKCQYPITEEWLDFHDLAIEPLSWGLPRAEFLVHTMRQIDLGLEAALPLLGRYHFHEEFVSAGVAVPARDGPDPRKPAGGR
jgi:4'-phosphopantetheinyl transferase EntD